jgi:cytochrome oxidase Cu insertion factor (SCO1/SenC/PrrC family)
MASLTPMRGCSDTVRPMQRLSLLAVLLVVLAACGGGSGDDEDARTTSAGSPAAVDIEGKTLDGERLSLAAFRGKPTFVNVWASW